MNFDPVDFEQFLSKGDFNADDLRARVELIDFLKPFRPGNPFPVGILAPDAIRVRINASPDDVAPTLTELTRQEAVRSIRVFPVGIVAPESFEIDVEIGRRHQR